MKIYLICILVLLCFDIIGKLYNMYTQNFKRTEKEMMFDGFISVAFLVWGITLL